MIKHTYFSLLFNLNDYVSINSRAPLKNVFRHTTANHRMSRRIGLPDCIFAKNAYTAVQKNKGP